MCLSNRCLSGYLRKLQEMAICTVSSKAFSSVQKSHYGNKSLDTALSQSKLQCTGDSDDQQKLTNVEPLDQRRGFVNGGASPCMSGKVLYIRARPPRQSVSRVPSPPMKRFI